MNKKIIVGVIVLVIIVSGISAFFLLNNNGKSLNSKENETNAKDILDNQDNNIMEGKTLVVYFSKAGDNYNVGEVEIGNTAMMASYIKEYLKADSFEIEPVNPYLGKYSEVVDKAKEEQENDERPKIKNNISNFNDYDTIFIGYPIWWGDIPQIVYTFLEEYDFTDKKVIPFNTHEGSGNSGTYNTIKSKLSKSVVETNGLAIQGKIARTDEGKEKTINWLKELGF